MPIHQSKIFLNSQLNSWSARWQKLKTFQKLYVLSALSIFISSPLAIFIALCALIVDFWPRFEKFWGSLAGKAITLVFYAAATNFAMTSAAGLVNEITGLDADYFTYTHYTAILLSLPAWLFGTSLVMLALLQVFFPFFFLTMFCLRLLGIRSTHIFKNLHYPIITMFLRFSLSLFLLVKVGEYYENDDKINENTIETAIADTLLETPATETESTNAHTEESKTPNTATANINDVNVTLKNDGYMANVRQLLSHFIFHFESNSRSRCKLNEHARSVELNEFQHVEITKDKSQPEGYKFEIKACISPGIHTPLSD